MHGIASKATSLLALIIVSTLCVRAQEALPEESATQLVTEIDIVDTAATELDMAGALCALPDDLLPLMPLSVRIALTSGGEGATVRNSLAGNSTMERLTRDYALIRLSAASTVEAALLRHKEECVLALLHTVSVDSVSDTRLRFINMDDMKELPADKMVKAPKPEDFFDFSSLRGAEKKEIQEAFAQIPFYTVEWTFSKDAATGAIVGLCARLPLRALVSAELFGELSPYLRERLYYSRTGTSFRAAK